MNKELFKELLDLKGQILLPRFGAQLKKYTKPLYYAGLFVVVLLLLQSLVTLVQGAISIALLQLIFAFVFFAIVRMFCEFLMDYSDK